MPDAPVTTTIQAVLAQHDLSPAEQSVDTGFMSADQLVHRADQRIDLIGRMQEDTSW